MWQIRKGSPGGGIGDKTLKDKHMDNFKGINTLEHWIRLDSIPGIGIANLNKLLQQFDGCCQSLLSCPNQQLSALGLSGPQITSLKQARQRDAEKVCKWLAQDKRRFVLTLNQPNYPKLLKETTRPPLLLYGIGDVGLLNVDSMAVVGTRNPTVQGADNAQVFSAELAKLGWAIVSGMALGIDTQAHKGALQVGGKTVAVLGTGVDVAYPKRNQALYQQIAGQGCVVSEFPLGTKPRPSNFPRRNRILTGLAKGVLVVEAAVKSGSLVSAKYALEQNREVFAIPGSILNTQSRGCHQLIKQGAKLAEQVYDITEEFPEIGGKWLQPDITADKKNSKQGLATDKLLASVGYETTPLDVVVQRSGLPVTAVLSQLLEYELRGLVASVPGGYTRLGEL